MQRIFFISSILLALALAVAGDRECRVRHVGPGTDAGPAINAAFARCSRHAKVTLDDFYTVNSLLFTTNLTDVEIELSGTSEWQ